MSDEMNPEDGAENDVDDSEFETDIGPDAEAAISDDAMGDDSADLAAELDAEGLSDDALGDADKISSRQVDVLAAASEIPPHSKERRAAFMGVPIDVTVSIGRARPLVSELIKLRRDSVLTLDSKIEDPVELFIGDRLIARGELQEMDDETGQLGVRLTEVADLSSGV